MAKKKTVEAVVQQEIKEEKVAKKTSKKVEVAAPKSVKKIDTAVEEKTKAKSKTENSKKSAEKVEEPIVVVKEIKEAPKSSKKKDVKIEESKPEPVIEEVKQKKSSKKEIVTETPLKEEKKSVSKKEITSKDEKKSVSKKEIANDIVKDDNRIEIVLEPLKPRPEPKPRPVVVEEIKPLIREPQPNDPDYTGPKYSDEVLEEFRLRIMDVRVESMEELRMLRERLEDYTNYDFAEESMIYSMHMAEQGPEALEQEKTYAQVQRISEYIKKLDDALNRIKDKSYGICRVCKCLIAKERLMAVPITTLSASHKIHKRCPEDGIDRIEPVKK